MRRLIAIAVGSALLSGCAAPSQQQPAQPPANPPAGPTVTQNAPAQPVTPANFGGASQLMGTNATPAPSQQNPTPGAPAPAPTPGPDVTGTTPKPPAAPSHPMAGAPQIAAGANYTMFCDSFSGPDHVQAANEMKRLLLSHTNLKDWFVIHDDQQSALYEGYYRQFDPAALPPDANAQDRADADRAQRDRATLEQIPDPRAAGARLFPRAHFVPLEKPDPDAPPEWNLANAPGYWSVQIAAFTKPGRKQAAVESVRAARESGIPAYYYHGESVSSVCIGSWPEAALKLPQGMSDVDQLDTNAVKDADRPVFVNTDPGTGLDEQIEQQLNQRGDKVQTLKTKAEIVDQTLVKTLQEYPTEAVDGYEQEIPGGNGEKRPSFVVKIPGKQPSALVTGASDDSRGPANGSGNGNGNASLGNRLRGIGQ